MLKVNKFAKKEIRGWILKILYTNLPEWAGDRLLAQMLEQGKYSVSALEIQGHLRYLEGKGYVEVKEVSVKELGLSRVVARLTSKGVDFVEGNLPDDPGIDRK